VRDVEEALAREAEASAESHAATAEAKDAAARSAIKRRGPRKQSDKHAAA